MFGASEESIPDRLLEQPTRTAVYGPVRTVVWQGSAGDRRPYADQWESKLRCHAERAFAGFANASRSTPIAESRLAAAIGVLRLLAALVAQDDKRKDWAPRPRSG